MKIMKKIVLYTSNSRLRDQSALTCTVFPKWAEQWDAVAEKYPDYEITLVAQLSGRYYLDIKDGAVVQYPEKVKVVEMEMEASLEDFVEKITSLKPDLVIGMPGPARGYDWNGLRDAGIAEQLQKRGIETICYSIKTALDTFDKWRTHQVFEANGFRCPKDLYVHHDLFFAQVQGASCNLYTEYILQQVKDMEMPVVIKSTTGSASMGIHIAKSYEDAEEYLLSEKNTEDVIVEQFIKGEEFGTEVHGAKGHYYVTPPYRLFNTASSGVNDPLGAATIKYGPILDEKYHVEELQKELERLANVMDFSGTLQIDVIFVDGEWYILEINSRWSGMTLLTTASQERYPYDIYLEQVEHGGKNYSDRKNLKYACQFKLPETSMETVEKISKEPHVMSVVTYLKITDVVITGFDSLEEMADALVAMQKKYPDVIMESVVNAFVEEIGR